MASKENPRREPPTGDEVTDFDRENLTLYLRVLDAHSSGASYADVAAPLFDLDADADPELAQRTYAAYLSRARWLAQTGHVQLLRK